VEQSRYIHKSHNVSVLLYHFVCPAKYRKIIFSKDVDYSLREKCIEISKRYDIYFLEIGTDKNHVHFLIQSVPVQSPSKIIQTVKSISAREMFKRHPEIRNQLWGGEFWSDGYFVNTVSKFGDESSISRYVREQGVEKEYTILHKEKQLCLF
jgi:REP element-mobilizing transposase RayT